MFCSKTFMNTVKLCVFFVNYNHCACFGLVLLAFCLLGCKIFLNFM